MNIKTIGKLKKLIANMSDDFTLDIDIMTELSEEELIKSKYPFPYSREKGYMQYHDTGYSDKVVCFGVYKSKRIE